MLNKPIRMVFATCTTLACLGLGACTVFSADDRRPVARIDPVPYFHDELFPAGALQLEAPEDFLTLPPAYQAELDRIMQPLSTAYERYAALRNWVFRRFQDYEFDSTETYSIAELNSNRKINCLSFSVIFVAAARYVNVPAEFQLVYAPPYWDGSNGTWINNQHVDVTGLILRDARARAPGLNTPLVNWDTGASAVTIYPNSEYLTMSGSRHFRYVVDINPAIVSMPLRREPLTDQQVLSLYFSNKSMQYLLEQDLPNAYAYTREALRIDSTSAGAWNNLGVIYARADQPEYAIAAFNLSLVMDAGMQAAESNLASLHEKLGNTELARAINERVAQYRQENPYYHQALAEASASAGDYAQAIVHLQDAVARKHNEHLFYHELAIAYQKLGDDAAVVENLTHARRVAKGPEKARFSGKLRALQELVVAGGANN